MVLSSIHDQHRLNKASHHPDPFGSETIALPPQRFVSGEEWNPQRIGALAMYCSDGRWGDAFDEFCHRSLQIPRYDRFAVPGGPAWLTEGAGQVHHSGEHDSVTGTA